MNVNNFVSDLEQNDKGKKSSLNCVAKLENYTCGKNLFAYDQKSSIINLARYKIFFTIKIARFSA